jgi:hypothetical protein
MIWNLDYWFGLVIPGRRGSGEPGIQIRIRNWALDSGFAPAARPGMTRNDHPEPA